MKNGGIPDRVDLALLEAIQDDIPLLPRPWQALGDRLGISGEEVIARLRALSRAGIIRGISPVLESGPLGLHAGTLVALRLPEGRVDEVAAIVSGFPEVSHNFRREGEYPLWFTVTARDRQAAEETLGRIRDATGVPATDMLDLPTLRRVKIDVRFRFLPREAGVR